MRRGRPRRVEEAFNTDDKVTGISVVTAESLADVCESVLLPCLEMPMGQSLARYGVIGRFHVYEQIRKMDPAVVAVAIVQPPDEGWDAGRVRALAEALFIVEAGGRARPVREFRALYESAREKPWASLRPGYRSRKRLAKATGCTKNQLRPAKPSSKE